MTDLPPVSMQDLSKVVNQAMITTMPGLLEDALKRDVPAIVRPIVVEVVRDVVSDEVSGIKAEVTTQGTLLRTLSSDVSSLKNQTRKLGILYEDLEGRFDTVIELIEGDMTVRDQVKTHETRISDLETGQALPKRHLT